MPIKPSPLFPPEEVANYYDHTRSHYRMFWQLDRYHTLHYGLWEQDVRTLGQAMLRTNQRLAELADITSETKVLDAGCGIGGPARWLAHTYGCEVIGLTLSQRQADRAAQLAQSQGVEDRCTFQQGDYRDMKIDDESIDVVWAIEAHATEVDKEPFIREAYRVLRPGGCLVMAEYLQTADSMTDADRRLMSRWLNHWAITELVDQPTLQNWLTAAGFVSVDMQDVSSLIKRSSRRLYYASCAGWVGIKLYNVFRTGTPFSRTHYRAGWAQYRALRHGLWSYQLIRVQKK